MNLSEEEEAYQKVYKEKICMFYCIFIEQIGHVTKQRDLREEFKNLVKTKNQTGFETFAK